jgi:hypothetical protein
MPGARVPLEYVDDEFFNTHSCASASSRSVLLLVLLRDKNFFNQVQWGYPKPAPRTRGSSCKFLLCF